MTPTATTYWTTFDSPVDELLLTSDGTSLTRLLFAPFTVDPTWSEEPCAVLDEAVAQLSDYFAGTRTDFDLPLEPAGHAVPADGLASAARDPLRRDDQLRPARAARRQPQRLARGRPGQRPQPDLDRGAVPPGHRRQRLADRLRRRARPQADAARPRAADRRRDRHRRQPAQPAVAEPR